MTPQPQPAAYWIELLEELTGGIPFEIINTPHFATTFSFFFVIYTSHWDRGFYDCMRQEIDYIQSGQNVIDAAVEFYDQRPRNGKQNMDKAFCAVDNLDLQTYLYLRCNGIKQ